MNTKNIHIDLIQRRALHGEAAGSEDVDAVPSASPISQESFIVLFEFLRPSIRDGETVPQSLHVLKMAVLFMVFNKMRPNSTKHCARFKIAATRKFT